MKSLYLLALCAPLIGFAQGPEVTSWHLNTDGSTGYNGIESNVQQVEYSTDYVYVTSSGIPEYSIGDINGDWPNNPNTATHQNFVFQIDRAPVENTGNKTETGLGHIGIWSNGVSIFNSKDGFTYNNNGVWNQNALMFEGNSFDDCLGHPTNNGEYHHHINPTCLYDDSEETTHSPIIGYAFDGFPIYGAFAYTETNGTGAIKRMESSYQLRNITDRTTLPDGTVLNSGQYGPTLATYALGYYLEDFEYVASSGDLDEHNGRYCVTPDYPGGTYAYFVTIDESADPVYPYTLGLTYYGILNNANTGPGSGNFNITESTTIYTPTSAAINESVKTKLTAYPNPVQQHLNIAGTSSSATLYDVLGKPLKVVSKSSTTISFADLAPGVYFLKSDEQTIRIVKK